MARISRKCYESNYFHIMVQGIQKEFIYSKSEYKEKYINFLIDAVKLYNAKILAYCVMDNHVHMLIYVNKTSELSKIMMSTNTKYAIYYNKVSNRVGYVFRDRYRCENIYTQNYLENCIRYIHNNPVAAGLCKEPSDYKFSSYNQFIKKEGIIDDDTIVLCFGDATNYLEKLKSKCIEDCFIDVNNEFGENDYESIDKVVSEEITEKGLNVEKLSDEELALLGNKILIRTKASKKEVAEILKINRVKFTRLLKKLNEE